jgi:phosphoenolpyruvate carboxykinase (GTP)
MCQPDNVFWCDGSEQEKEILTKIAVQTGDLLPLNQKELPGCYLHRSALNDVARTENLTFVCTDTQEEAGPNNNWMSPGESYDKLAKIFAGSCGRTLYVIPFLIDWAVVQQGGYSDTIAFMSCSTCAC